MSNVSPDSSIYCHNPSPSPQHQPSHAHSPQHPPNLKDLPSPPHSKMNQNPSPSYDSSNLDDAVFQPKIKRVTLGVTFSTRESNQNPETGTKKKLGRLSLKSTSKPAASQGKAFNFGVNALQVPETSTKKEGKASKSNMEASPTKNPKKEKRKLPVVINKSHSSYLDEARGYVPRNLFGTCFSETKAAPAGTTYAPEDAMRLKHEQPGKFPSNISSSGAVREGPTDLEVHCSMSNVSPDSSKYCINQSPSPRVQPSLAHSPQLLGGVTSTGSARASKSTPKKSSAYTCFPSNKLAPAGSADSQCKKPLKNVPVGYGFKKDSDTGTNSLETKKSTSTGTTYAQKDTMRLKHEQPVGYGFVSSPLKMGSDTETNAARGGATDLEVNSSMSNVSPDSSIYCHNPSPSPQHQPSHAHSPQHPDSSDLDEEVFQPKRKRVTLGVTFSTRESNQNPETGTIKKLGRLSLKSTSKPAASQGKAFNFGVNALQVPETSPEKKGKARKTNIEASPTKNPQKKKRKLVIKESEDSSDLDEAIFKPKRQRVTSESLESHLTCDFRSEAAASPEEGVQKKKLQCRFCQKSFSCHQSLSRHKKICKSNLNPRPCTLVCNTCKKQFSRRYMFKAHVTNCSGKKLPNHGVGNMSCPYDKCLKRFMFKIDLCEHLYADHKADIKPPETHLFKNFEEFSKFKTKIEDETYSYYSQQFGKRNGRTYYYCQHDGAQKSHRRNDEATRKTDRRNKKGPIKKNNLCLSMMAVKCLPNGSIQVAYRPTHLHPCRPQDLKHQPLSTETNQYISKLLSWNVPPSKIVECLRGDSYKRNNRLSRSSIKLKRDNLVKKKTITERMRKKKSSLRFSNNDAESVYMKVNKLIQENYNPVLMYKPLGEKTIIGPKGSENLPDDVFVLAIQSKEQLEMMVEGCKEILVIDETHSTNSYDYKLLNLMVRDKFNLGYPVGHAICHPSEETTLQYVFKAIKERCPDLSINCCITDDDPKLINSVNAGLGEAIWHLLCVWHIHRTIQSNLRERIKDNDLVNEIYGIMCVLIEECDESQFIQLKDSFLNEYSNNCPEFTKYFNNTFFPKAHKWAKCYRLKPHAETETTMLVESFHNILKTHYMKRAPCKRLDDLIDLLLDIEEDYYVRYTNSVLLKTMSDKDHRALSRRHLKGIEIKDSDVTLVSERFWTVKSQEKDSSEVYSVVMCADQCSSDSCIYACCYCDTLCSHLFSCSCPDMFPLCKHIHKVFSMIELSKPLEKEKKEPEFFLGAFENNIPLVEETAADSRSNYTERSVQQRIQKIREIMEDFDKTYLDNSPVKRILPQIETTLTDLQTQCKVLCFDPPRAVPEMEVKTQTAPNEKLQKQLTPFVKKTKKRKPTALKKPHKKCVTEIKDFLLQEHQESEENVDSDLAPLSELNHEQATDEPTIDIDNPLDVVIEYQGIKVLSLHLKALNPTLDERELPLLLQADSKFVHGYLYDEVINIFLKMICNESVYACDTTVAQRLCSGNQNFKSLPKKLSSKEFILFPGNSGNHWIIIVAEVKSSSLWLYNSLSCTGSLLSTYERQMLSAVAKFLKNVFIETKSWSIKRHFDIQKDTVSCGVHICWFALLLTRKYNLAPLENPSDFRQHIYDSILLQKDL